MRSKPQWLQARALGLLLQSPAHRVLRVLLVTQTHWQLPEHCSHRARGRHA